MTVKKAIKILKKHNKWRRGKNYDKLDNPKDIGIAIDVLIDKCKS